MQENEGDCSHIVRHFRVRSDSDAYSIGKFLGLKIFLLPHQYLQLQSNYSQKQFPLVCKLSEEVLLEGLIIILNIAPCIIQQISVSKFPFLEVLCISFNQIETIDSLCCLQVPALKHFDLSNNKISNLKSMRKMFAPVLEQLLIGGNNYVEVPELLLQPSISYAQISITNKIKMGKIFTLNPNQVWNNSP